MTGYDRDLLNAFKEIGRQLKELNKTLKDLPKPLTRKDLPDLETYFEEKEEGDGQEIHTHCE